MFVAERTVLTNRRAPVVAIVVVPRAGTTFRMECNAIVAEGMTEFECVQTPACICEADVALLSVEGAIGIGPYPHSLQHI